jgi:uncharacterized DUF497 family protein
VKCTEIPYIQPIGTISGFEWDDAKAELHLRKQGLSFIAAGDVFLDPDRIDVDASRPGDAEPRRETFGTVDGEFVAVVYVVRAEVVRLISAWRARRKEAKRGDRSIHA